MRVAKIIALGLLVGSAAMFAMGGINVALGTEPRAASTLEGLAFAGGHGLGVWLAVRGQKPTAPKLTVPPEEWSKR
jgi:hypothetical protein